MFDASTLRSLSSEQPYLSSSTALSSTDAARLMSSHLDWHLLEYLVANSDASSDWVDYSCADLECYFHESQIITIGGDGVLFYFRLRVAYLFESTHCRPY